MKHSKTESRKPDLDRRLKWWRESRFGLFIHWGLYALPAGKWKDRPVPGIGEWIMHRGKIPAAEYEKLAGRFNPTRFDAKAWVALAVEAGMKYLVITSKHHDGFAMYDSKADSYNIVDATPFGRDPMKELAAECRKAGLRMCFYYSQDQDWHHPGGSGNDWDYPDRTTKEFAHYLKTKVKPQLKELLTQYGPIGLIWFDTPWWITKAQSLDLKRYVHRLQPKCLVSGRVGHDVGDYGSFGDNQIPVGRIAGDWETPATLNDTWGFKTDDHKWKSVRELLYLLIDLTGKGVNYLLNVGPTAEGIIPKPSVDRLREIGEWTKRNGEAIYGTEAGPFPCEIENCRFTQKGRRLYVMLMKWPRNRRLSLVGLKTKVRRAALLARPTEDLEFIQTSCQEPTTHQLEVKLPAKKTDPHVSVLVLELVGRPEVDPGILQQPSGKIELNAFMGKLHPSRTGRQIRLNPTGATENWFTRSNSISWTFKMTRPGTYRIELGTSLARRQPKWVGNHKLTLAINRKKTTRRIRAQGWRQTPRAQYFPEAITRFGTVTFKKPGTYTARLKADEIAIASSTDAGGIILTSIELFPQ
ncbi:MAG: alpha-L-fucosidase [Verrucomicrobia bacterium]|nr:MAG: alpha-L-fucosidase [Verrucomicrobiota bacterium]